jgi:TetR/AcrR family transcriptional regulator, regulator of autoinduction and epiphytic fitness
VARAIKNKKPASQTSGGSAPLKLTQRKHLDIIQAAVQEFQAKGFLGTSMDAISARAGVSKRTVYNHFASKEGLFQGVVLALWNEAMGAQAYDYRPDKPLADQLKAIAQREIDFLKHPSRFALARVIVAECVRSPELGKRIYQEVEGSGAGIFAWIKQAVADGRLNAPDPVMAAYLFSSLIEGMAFWPQVVGGQPALSEAKRGILVDTVVAMFLGQFGREGE